VIKFFTPFIVFMILSYLITKVQRRTSPRNSARISMAVLLLGAATSLSLLVHFSIMWLMVLPRVGPILHNILNNGSEHFGGRSELYFIALVILVIATIKAMLLVRSDRQIRRSHCGGLVVVSDSEMFAYALPGAQDGVVISQGLVQGLSKNELNVVLAHEQAHLDNRHDRWILVGRICTSFNPLLRHPMSNLRFALERIADEAAVGICGNRQYVARTIAKVALGQSKIDYALGMASFGVVDRVRDLSYRKKNDGPLRYVVLGVGLMSLAALSALQWHHIALAIATVCV